MSQISERLRQRRKALKLTQEQLADLAGKSQKQIWQYETGRVQPGAEVLADFALALDTTADYLIGLTDNPERPLRNTQDLTDTEREIIRVLRSRSKEFEQKFLELIKIDL